MIPVVKRSVGGLSDTTGGLRRPLPRLSARIFRISARWWPALSVASCASGIRAYRLTFHFRLLKSLGLIALRATKSALDARPISTPKRLSGPVSTPVPLLMRELLSETVEATASLVCAALLRLVGDVTPWILSTSATTSSSWPSPATGRSVTSPCSFCWSHQPMLNTHPARAASSSFPSAKAVPRGMIRRVVVTQLGVSQQCHDTRDAARARGSRRLSLSWSVLALMKLKQGTSALQPSPLSLHCRS